MSSQPSPDPIRDIFTRLVGDLRGPSRLWLDPDEDPEEGLEEGRLELILEGRFALYRYRRSTHERHSDGQYTFGYNSILQRFEASWVDSFHNGRAMMFCTGQANPHGFFVIGHYPDPSGGPDWGWRTEVEIINGDRLQIASYNISPSGMEARATESILSRVMKSS